MRSELMSRVVICLPSLSILLFKIVNSNWLLSIKNRRFIEEQARFGEAHWPSLLIHFEKFDNDYDIVFIFHLFQLEDDVIHELPFPPIFKDVLSTLIFFTYHDMVLMKCLFENNDDKLCEWNQLTSYCKEVLNLSDMNIKDMVASFVYSQKWKCYVAFMFLNKMINDQVMCRFAVLPIKRNEFHHYKTIPSNSIWLAWCL